MPPDDVSEQLDTNSFSNNISLLQPAPGHSQNRLKSTKPELSRPKSGKRRRIGEKCPDLNSVTLMKEVLQSGGTVSPELLARIQRSVDEEERSHHPSQATRSSRPRRQETKSASSNFKPSPFTGMGPSVNESSSHRQGTSFADSSANPTPFIDTRNSINQQDLSDFDPIARSQFQIATSASSVPTPRDHDFKTRNSNLTLYQCTFKLCDKIFPSKSDWKRHEESVHKQRYMCMECGAPLADPRGGYACGLCLEAPFASLDYVKMHTIQCEEAQNAGKSFTRKDHLREHLRDKHGQLRFSKDAFDWVYDVDSDWPRECGFCGDPLYDVCILWPIFSPFSDIFVNHESNLLFPSQFLQSNHVVHNSESSSHLTLHFPIEHY
jgi:hypothetical protein